MCLVSSLCNIGIYQDICFSNTCDMHLRTVIIHKNIICKQVHVYIFSLHNSLGICLILLIRLMVYICFSNKNDIIIPIINIHLIFKKYTIFSWTHVTYLTGLLLPNATFKYRTFEKAEPNKVNKPGSSVKRTHYMIRV